MRPFEQWDSEQLKEAREIVGAVLERYLGVPGFPKRRKRMETILQKLDELLAFEE